MSEQRLPDAAAFPWRLTTVGPQQTRDWGRQVARLLSGGEIILLYGALGTGKTCFVQGLCAELDVTEEVVSPTFTLVNTYTGRERIHHVDLYRVEPDHDLADIGLPDILDEVWDGQAVLLVEWPGPLLVELERTRYVEMLSEVGRRDDERHWHVRGRPDLSDRWQALLTDTCTPE